MLFEIRKKKTMNIDYKSKAETAYGVRKTTIYTRKEPSVILYYPGFRLNDPSSGQYSQTSKLYYYSFFIVKAIKMLVYNTKPLVTHVKHEFNIHIKESVKKGHSWVCATRYRQGRGQMTDNRSPPFRRHTKHKGIV